MTQLTFDELRGAIGTDLGYTPWIPIDQSRIDLFADAVDDHQWIHVDPERAATGPFGSTIAHGYLTLSTAGSRLAELLSIEGASRIINYGVDRVRFPAPVPAGAQIRVHAVIADVAPVSGGLHVVVNMDVGSDCGDKPVCVAALAVRVMDDDA